MMIKRISRLAAWWVSAVLLFFTLRRWLFVIAALKQDKASDRVDVGRYPTVLLLTPLRNEAESLPDLLLALDRLNYPAQKLTVVFVNDGSTDRSEAILQEWILDRPNWRLLSLAQNVGKAQALNTALAQFPEGEVVAIYDADERPEPEALNYLVRPFVADRRVGGVSGRRAISNSLASPAASYTTFEGLVHQLITMRAKERLNLAPAILGANCAYRRTALVGAGNFKPGALLEDSDLTLKLVRTGWTIRFEPGAVSYHQTPQTITGYWRQHTRWARGFNDVAKEQSGGLLFDRRLPLPLRLELLIFSLGYLDRLALLAGAALALPGSRLAAWAVAASLLTPFVQVMAALKIAQAPPALWRRLIWMPLFFMVDIAMAATGFWTTLANLPQRWEERRARK
jgi:cellulose synthase/poly-beta-1,6-N-acetylglucosamine synthase-like glycosyltransferase